MKVNESLNFCVRVTSIKPDPLLSYQRLKAYLKKKVLSFVICLYYGPENVFEIGLHIEELTKVASQKSGSPNETDL